MDILKLINDQIDDQIDDQINDQINNQDTLNKLGQSVGAEPSQVQQLAQLMVVLTILKKRGAETP
jgi:hypothetical protein